MSGYAAIVLFIGPAKGHLTNVAPSQITPFCYLPNITRKEGHLVGPSNAPLPLYGWLFSFPTGNHFSPGRE